MIYAMSTMTICCFFQKRNLTKSCSFKFFTCYIGYEYTMKIFHIIGLVAMMIKSANYLWRVICGIIRHEFTDHPERHLMYITTFIVYDTRLYQKGFIVTFTCSSPCLAAVSALFSPCNPPYILSFSLQCLCTGIQ